MTYLLATDSPDREVCRSSQQLEGIPREDIVPNLNPIRWIYYKTRAILEDNVLKYLWALQAGEGHRFESAI